MKSDDEINESDDELTIDKFYELKEALLCPICYDVLKNPVRVK
jgi:hypothetical protein